MKAVFTKDDLKIDCVFDFCSYLLVLPFVGLVAPFLIASYTLGFCLNLVGWQDT